MQVDRPIEADQPDLRIGHGRADADGLPPIEVGIIHRRAGIPPLRRAVPLHGRDRGQHIARDVLADIPRPIEHPHEQPPAPGAAGGTRTPEENQRSIGGADGADGAGDVAGTVAFPGD